MFQLTNLCYLKFVVSWNITKCYISNYYYIKHMSEKGKDKEKILIRTNFILSKKYYDLMLKDMEAEGFTQVAQYLRNLLIRHLNRKYGKRRSK